MRALFAENPGYRAWNSLYDATKCFKSRGTDGSARCHSSAAMNHQLGTPPSMGPLRAVKSAVRATYGENAGSRACHSSVGPAQCVESRGIDGGARWNAPVAVKPPHSATPSMGLSWAVKSAVRPPYAENSGSRA